MCIEFLWLVWIVCEGWVLLVIIDCVGIICRCECCLKLVLVSNGVMVLELLIKRRVSCELEFSVCNVVGIVMEGLKFFFMIFNVRVRCVKVLLLFGLVFF